MAESQKGFVAIIGLIVAVVIGLAVGTYAYRTNTKDQVEPATPVDTKGGFYYDGRGLRFLVPAYEDGEISHMHTLSFDNESEAIRDLGIDTSKLDGKDAGCNITNESQAVISASGYSPGKAEANWSKQVTTKVHLESVIVPASSKVICSTP